MGGAVERPDNGGFLPHLSLLYLEMPLAEKEALARRLLLVPVHSQRTAAPEALHTVCQDVNHAVELIDNSCEDGSLTRGWLDAIDQSCQGLAEKIFYGVV